MLISHLAAGPHLSDHQVPELSLCLQVGLKHLSPAGRLDAQGGDAQQEEGRRRYLHLLAWE